MLPGDLKPGALLGGKYRVERLIGRGGMGAVFLATHAELGRKVAVKVLDLSIDGDPQSVERFKREGRAAAAISHPGVVEVLDTGATEWGMPYLVMEYLEGPTLRQFFRNEGPLAPGLAAAIAVPVLDALAAAHRAGVLHRDLKPANVLLSIHPRREVKLLDFGISKFLRSTTVITRTGMALGTPAYMAPEQVEGEKELTPAADLYSVGVILFQLLAGRLPFVADNDLLLMRMVVMTQAPPLQSVRADVSQKLGELVDRLLARDPGNRPGDAAEVRRAILEAVEPTPDQLWWRVEHLAERPTNPFADRVSEQLHADNAERAARPTAPDRLERPTSPAAWPAEASGDRALGASTEPALAAVAMTRLLGEPRRKGLSKRALAGWALVATAVAGVMYLVGASQRAQAREAETARAAAQQAQARTAREALVARAQNALATGDLEQAERYLNACTLASLPCPEAAAVREKLRAERQFSGWLDLAERAVAAGNSAAARRLLADSGDTEVFRSRWVELEARATALAEGAPRRPAVATSPEVERLVDEAREHTRNLQQPQARDKLTLCLKLEPDNATCHKLLGSTYANLKDPKRGVFHYKKFLELRPDDPSAARVKEIIDAYESSQK